MTQQLSPEEYQQLLSLGSQNSQLSQQMEMAKMLRLPLQQRGSPGGYQVAPHWTEGLSNLVNQVGAQGAGKKQTDNTARQNDIMMRAILAMSQQQGQQGQPPAGNGMMPPSPRAPTDFGGY